MKVLIVVPKFTRYPGEFYHTPLGLAYIVSALKAAGFGVHCLNCNESADATEVQVARTVLLVDPDVCATGALSPFLAEVQKVFAGARRAKPKIFNVAGGGVLSSDPEAGPIVMDIDVGVIGEGEATIVEVVHALQCGGDLNAVQGIVYRNAAGNIIRTNARPAIADLGTIAWPDYDSLGFDKLISLQRTTDTFLYHTSNRPRAINMITSRSCPYRCTFCFHPTGKIYRERPLDDFFAELDHIVGRYDINMVALIDELFSLKKSRLIEFCDRIEPYKLKWMVQLHVNCADDHILRRMKETGAAYISYGIESMSQDVLISMQKKSKTERINSVLANTYEKRIGIQGNLIFGDSAETLETANESMRWWVNNLRYKVWLARLMVFPGSPDYIQAVRDGLITDRLGFIEDQSAVGINISKMNDVDLDGITLKIELAHRAILEFAPVTTFQKEPVLDPLRGDSYQIIWDCPRCDHRNDFQGVQLTWENYCSIRFGCRECGTRFDLHNPAEMAFEDRPTRDVDAYDHARAIELIDAGDVEAGIVALRDLVTRRIWYFPGHLALGRIYRDRGEKLLALRHFSLALKFYPRRPELHIEFADHMVWERAIGMAKLYYQQALHVDPGNSEAAAKLAGLEGQEWTDEERGTFFVSYSDVAAPKRLHGPNTVQERRKDEREFPDIAKLQEVALQELMLAE